MKKPIILFSLFVIVTSVRAQEGTDFNPQPKPEVELKKKNEISINTAPLFRVLLNASSSEATRFSATYKRNLNCHSALRLSIMADMMNGDNYYTHPWNDVIILQTDSVMIKQSQVAPGYVSPHINIGYERLFGKHKLQWFYGADLLVGYAQNKSYLQNTTLIRDTAQGSSAWVERYDLKADVVSKTEKKIVSVGISPFFGAKYPISKRFSLSAQVGFDLTFRHEDLTITKGSFIDKLNVSSFDFNSSTGILNDISLVYKF